MLAFLQDIKLACNPPEPVTNLATIGCVVDFSGIWSAASTLVNYTCGRCLLEMEDNVIFENISQLDTHSISLSLSLS
jgi:hypothetical protein